MFVTLKQKSGSIFLRCFLLAVLSIPLSAIAQLTSDVTSINFGKRTVGLASAYYPTQRTVTIQNTSASPVEVSVVFTSPADYSTYSTCTGMLGAGQYCYANIYFAPVTAGFKSDTVWIQNPTTGHIYIAIPMQGEGGYPSYTVTPMPLDFGDHSMTTPGIWRAVTLTSTSDFQIVNINSSFSGDVLASNASCGGFNAVGQTCVMNFLFSASGLGARPGNITITTATNAPVVLPFTGNGLPPPTLSIGSSSVSFPQQPFGVTASTVQYVWIWNSGGGPLNVNSVTSGRFDFRIDTSTCPTTLAPNTGCYLGVSFTPYASGARDRAITINHTGANGAVSFMANGSGLIGTRFLGNAVRIIAKEGEDCRQYEGGPPCNWNEDDNNRLPPCPETGPLPAGGCRIDVTATRLPDDDGPDPEPEETEEDAMRRHEEELLRLRLLLEQLHPVTDQSDPCAGGAPRVGGQPSGGLAPSKEDVNGIRGTMERMQPSLIDIGRNVSDMHLFAAGDPISTVTGNKLHVQRDYDSPGGMRALSFRRTYASLSSEVSSQHQTFIGAGWVMNWDKTLVLENASTRARLSRGDSTDLLFNLVNGVWTPEARRSGTLIKETNAGGATTGWVLTRQQRTERYGADGRLESTTYRSGRTVTLTYTSSSPRQLTQISGSDGRSLALQYDTLGRLSKLTDPSGGTYDYFYDQTNRLIKIRYPDAKERQYRYDDAKYKFAMTSIIDEAGSVYASFEYDPATGRATKSQFSGGIGATTVSYLPDGRSVTTQPSGVTITRGFSTVDDKPIATSWEASCTTCAPNGSQGAVSESYAYTTTGALSQFTNRQGIVTTYSYNARGLVASKTEAGGTTVMRTTSYTYHPTLNVPTQIVEPTRVTNITYDAMGRILTHSTTADGQTRTITKTYTLQGMVASVKGSRTDINDTTSYTYDAMGNLTSVTNPKGHLTTYSNYDANGNARQISYPDGRVEIRTFDARSRMLTQTVDGGTTTYVYDARGLLTSKAFPDGSSEATLYDATYRVIGKDLSNGEKLRYTLDSAGRTIKTETFDAQNILATTTTTGYDGLNRVTWRKDAQGKTTSYTYDANGNVTAVTDPNNFTTQTAYDALNRPILVTDPLGKTTSTAYNWLDKPTSITDPKGNTTTYSYSGFGENTQIQSPDTGTTTQTFNAGGMVLTKTDARGKTATYTYDVLGRITAVTYTDAQTNISQTYDVGVSGVGRLASVTDYSGSTSYSYDAYGRVASRTTTINAPANSGQINITKTISFTRDSIGRVTAMTYPSGKVLGTVYGADGRISGYTLAPNASTAGVTLISGIQYFPLGGAESWLLGGTTKDYTRLIDQNSRIQKYTTPSGYRALTFDNAGRITQIGDYIGSATTASATQTIGYDNVGRLTSFTGFTSNGLNTTTGQGNPAITQTQNFTYDNNGNRLTSVLNSVSSTYTTQATSNRLTSVAGGVVRNNVYDQMGNLTSHNTAVSLQMYQYDDRGRLKFANVPGMSNGNIRYSVNYQGLRVRKANATTPSNTTNTRAYIYDDNGHMLGEYDVAGTALQEIIWLNDTPVAVTGIMPCLTSGTNTAPGSIGNPSCTENAAAYIFTDHLNTPREIARINTANNTYVSLWKWDSLPFGETSPNENPSSRGVFTFNHRFPGQYYDKETGLHQNWHREYDPKLGRYIESDPLGLRAGVNTYAYVHADPISFTDSSGLYWEYCVGPITGELSYFDPATGIKTFIGYGNAGSGSGRNNPSMQCVINSGPPPNGTYTIGAAGNRFGPNSMRLNPRDNRAATCNGARTGGYFLHNPESGSIGCVQLSDSILAQIANSSDKEFRVVGQCASRSPSPGG
jgi:RHS repeat-associated protein